MPITVSARPARHGPLREVRRCWLLMVLPVLICTAGVAPVWASPDTTTPPPVATSPAVPVPRPQTPAPVTPAAPTPPTTAPTAPAPPPGLPCAQTSGGCAQQPETRQGPLAAPEPECGLDNISGCVVKAMDGFFSTLVSSALNPLLELLSTTLLATPDPASLPRVGQLWTSSWQITLTLYGLLVMAAGLLLMSYQTLQERWSLREIAPGLVLGMIAAALSFPLITQAVRAANTLSVAVAGDGVDPDSAGQALRQLVTVNSDSMIGLFGLLLAVVLVVLVVGLLVGYVIRVAVTIVLIVAAPLALMCHALPVTEPIARWWWRSMGACLAIQFVQSLTLITATRVFLTPGGWRMSSDSDGGIVDLIVAIALVGVLAKTPFWMLSAMRIGSGRSLAGGMVRSYLTYKTFGLLRHRSTTATRKSTSRKPESDASDPYRHVQTAANGQMLLPLQGLTRTPRKSPPPLPPDPTSGHRSPGSRPSSTTGRQLELHLSRPARPLPREAPRPDGQYALFYATPATKPPARRRPSPANATPAAGPPSGVPAERRAAKGRQLALRFPPPQQSSPPAQPRDVYARPKVTAQGQYVLPLGVTRVRRPAPPPAPAWIAPPAPRPAGRQLHLPLPDLPVRRRLRRDTGGGSR
ncbi:hypothetical protein [Nocardia blacklockiae]|uniref:hypothetical protein n=1 Tax=Nocardia blacklockiae TaxID=480036 RepID=UPI001895F47C|nr:hypothetical protein [Nocardia blacklockiae]MBF6175201.1 hypothetical protein [Nocardia blacklockiae]